MKEKLIEQKVNLFKSLLNEAVRDKDVARARELIIKYLTKKLGTKFVPLPAEDFTNNVDGRATGLRFVFNKNDSIRFNWAGTKAGGNELTSVDVWLKDKYYPDFNLPLKGVSLARALPTIVEFLNDPSGDEYAIIPEAESMSEMFDLSSTLTEGRKAGYSKHSAEDLWKLAISYLKKGEPVDYKDLFAKSQKAYKIYTEIKNTFPEMWDKKIYIGDNFKLQQNEGRILKQLGLIQVIVQKGATSETPIVELPDEVVALELEMKKGQDNIGYEDAVEDLKSSVRLLKKGVTNALFISGRGWMFRYKY